MYFVTLLVIMLVSNVEERGVVPKVCVKPHTREHCVIFHSLVVNSFKLAVIP